MLSENALLYNLKQYNQQVVKHANIYELVLKKQIWSLFVDYLHETRIEH